jgi:hypothetical protein
MDSRQLRSVPLFSSLVVSLRWLQVAVAAVMMTMIHVFLHVIIKI